MNFKDIKERIVKKINKQSVKTFFQKQGLYVLIFLCIAAAGITAIIAWPKPEVAEPGVSGSDQDVVYVPSSEASPTITVKPSAAVTPQPTPSASPEPSQPVTANQGSGRVTLKKPVDGSVINGFSGDELVFFASMNMWATHNGIDIQADMGAKVSAAMAGTVIQIYKSDSEGGVVIISHSDTSRTVYKGLDEVTVEAGEKVNAGQQIGTVGQMPSESDLSYHLHFEYIVDGKYKNPANFF
jgi:murein DD-endopeptidase MepM/ murein hydrolase activator NlpD